MGLPLPHRAHHPIPILTGISLAGDMNPTGALRVAFPDQLIEGSVVHQPAEPCAPLGDGGQMQVGRLPTQMLALRDTPDRSVEGRTAIATTDHDRFSCEGTERFEHHLAEGFQVRKQRLRHPVVDAKAVGGGGALKLLHGEMFGYLLPVGRRNTLRFYICLSLKNVEWINTISLRLVECLRT